MTISRRGRAPRARAPAEGPSVLVLDLETVPDPTIPQPADPEKFPAPPCHQIACAGYALLDSSYVVESWGVVGADGQSELEILELLVKLMGLDPVVVTLNGRAFDLPVVAARCFVHGLSIPWYYQSRHGARYRYSMEQTHDVMDWLADHGAAPRAKLDVWSCACGWPGKQGESGRTVAERVAAGGLAEVCAYCLRDVCQSVAVFLRAELLRGALDRDTYRVAAAALLDRAEADPRTAALALGVDRARFLLEPAMVAHTEAAAEVDWRGA